MLLLERQFQIQLTDMLLVTLRESPLVEKRSSCHRFRAHQLTVRMPFLCDHTIDREVNSLA